LGSLISFIYKEKLGKLVNFYMNKRSSALTFFLEVQQGHPINEYRGFAYGVTAAMLVFQ
jgi:hypothetical protein